MRWGLAVVGAVGAAFLLVTNPTDADFTKQVIEPAADAAVQRAARSPLAKIETTLLPALSPILESAQQADKDALISWARSNTVRTSYGLFSVFEICEGHRLNRYMGVAGRVIEGNASSC